MIKMTIYTGMTLLFFPQVKFSEDIGITAQEASRLFIFIGIASSMTRLVSGKLCSEKNVNPVYIYQASVLLAGLSTFLLPFSTKYWHLIAFSVAYGLSDGVFITIHNYILLSCVDAKRRTASFSINHVFYAMAATAGGPIAGRIRAYTQPGLGHVPAHGPPYGHPIFHLELGFFLSFL